MSARSLGGEAAEFIGQFERVVNPFVAPAEIAEFGEEVGVRNHDLRSRRGGRGNDLPRQRNGSILATTRLKQLQMRVFSRRERADRVGC